MGIWTADGMVNSHGDAAVITDSFCRLSLLTAIAWSNLALPQQLPAPGGQPEPKNRFLR